MALSSTHFNGSSFHVSGLRKEVLEGGPHRVLSNVALKSIDLKQLSQLRGVRGTKTPCKDLILYLLLFFCALITVTAFGWLFFLPFTILSVIFQHCYLVLLWQATRFCLWAPGNIVISNTAIWWASTKSCESLQPVELMAMTANDAVGMKKKENDTPKNSTERTQICSQIAPKRLLQTGGTFQHSREKEHTTW